MFGSSILDIAIGMVFIYLLLSLICSAANEIIERYSKKRASDLENGIREMFQSQDLVKELYEHPLVYSLFAKPYSPGGKNLPSYIPARNFALALMDLIGKGAAQGATGSDLTKSAEGAMANLRATIQANQTLPDNVKNALLTFVDSSHNPARVRENIENWFDSAMDRVSGTYKRRSQLIILVLGLVIAILVNVNSITLVRALSSDRSMRDSLVAAATEYAKANPLPSPSPSPTGASTPSKGIDSESSSKKPAGNPATSPKASPTPSPSVSPARSAAGSSANPSASPSPNLTPSSGRCKDDTPECRIQNNLLEIKNLEIPIGWTQRVRDDFNTAPWQTLLMSLMGWLITALAVSLGAPFWFDMLNKFIVVRSTVKPKEKSPEEGSKD